MKNINYAYLSGAMEGALASLKYDLILKGFCAYEKREELEAYIDRMIEDATKRTEDYSNSING